MKIERALQPWLKAHSDAQIDVLDVGGAGEGDRIVEGGGWRGVGHLGDAWGLRGAFIFDRESRDGLVFLAGGSGFDPMTRPGKYSSFFRYEERIMTTLLS